MSSILRDRDHAEKRKKNKSVCSLILLIRVQNWRGKILSWISVEAWIEKFKATKFYENLNINFVKKCVDTSKMENWKYSSIHGNIHRKYPSNFAWIPTSTLKSWVRDPPLFHWSCFPIRGGYTTWAGSCFKHLSWIQGEGKPLRRGLVLGFFYFFYFLLLADLHALHQFRFNFLDYFGCFGLHWFLCTCSTHTHTVIPTRTHTETPSPCLSRRQ